jgi:hypothetical protein
MTAGAMMKTRWTVALIFAGAALAAAGPAWAQTRSSSGGQGSTSQGLFGQNTVGSSSNFAAPTASTGGSGTSGNSSQGATGAQNPFAEQNIGAAGAAAPQITTTQQRGQFVGADRGDTANALSRQTSQVRSAQSNNFAQLSNLFAQGMQAVNQNNQQGGQQRARTPIRIGLKLGFRPAPASPTSVAAFQSRLADLPGIRFMGPAEVTLEGRTAVLRGTVASEEDRELAEALARMEPDVQTVRNELVVDSSATAAEELPLAPASNSP